MKYLGVSDKNFYIQKSDGKIHLTILGRCYEMSANDAELIGVALIQYAGDINAEMKGAGT